MARDVKISHADINGFGQDHVNLRREDVDEHRAQVGRLRNKLETHIDAHPGFDLVKMLQSGSLAKGTALRTINDIDIAVYVKAGEAPADEAKLIESLAARLREAYSGHMNPDQFVPQHHCVQVQFRVGGLDAGVEAAGPGAAPNRRSLLSQKRG